jgi:hypothetical protein
MDDLRRHDAQRLVREIVSPGRLFVSLAAALAVFVMFAGMQNNLGRCVFGWVFILLGHFGMAMQAADRKKWTNSRMAALWSGCQDRMTRFEDVLKRMRKDQVADLQEMPKTIRQVSQSLYAALRRADIIATEVEATERGMLGQPPSWDAQSRDAQSRELYRLADRNIAEYRGHFAAVMAGVQRTEAQSAVFMTTLDSLRMKLIGYRLVGRSPELATQEFLDSIAEARAQLQAIDTALDELDLGHYPKTISIVPPPIPDDIMQRVSVGKPPEDPV